MMKKGLLKYKFVAAIFAAMFVVVFISSVSANTPPVVTNPSATPDTIPADGTTKFVLNVTVIDDIAVDTVTINLTSIGGNATTTMQRLNGNVYSHETTIAVGTTPVLHYLKVNATDTSGNYKDTVSITLEATTRVKGDFDGDVDVDFDDFVDFAAAYGATTCADPNYNSIADFDNDCNVDFDDFVEFAGVYTG